MTEAVCPICGTTWCAESNTAYCVVTGRDRKALDKPQKDKMVHAPAAKKGIANG